MLSLTNILHKGQGCYVRIHVEFGSLFPIRVSCAQHMTPNITAASNVSLLVATTDSAYHSVALSFSAQNDDKFSTYTSCLDLGSAWTLSHATRTSIWSHTAYRGKDSGFRCVTYMSDGGHNCTAHPLPTSIVTETEYIVPKTVTYTPPAACCNCCFLDVSNVQVLYFPPPNAQRNGTIMPSAPMSLVSDGYTL